MPERLVRLTVPEKFGDVSVDEVMRLEWVSHVDEWCGSRVLARPVDEADLDVVASPGQPRKKTVRVAVRLCSFKVRDMHLSSTLKALRHVGVGDTFGAIDVLDVRTTTERAVKAPRRRGGGCPSLGDRLSTLEIHATIEASSHLTADHVCCVVLASFLAAIGLLCDSSSIVLAAFFISPLMTMLLGVTWGTCVGETTLTRRALRNMVLDATICWFVGAFVGVAIGACLPHSPAGLTSFMHDGGHGKAWGAISVNSSEILSRGPPVSNLVVSAFVATFSGVALALGYSGGISSALAGVAVSTALLPPLVNVGLMMALAVFYPAVHTDRGTPLVVVASNSFAIYVVNVFLVCALSFITLKFKRVGGRSLSNIQQVFAPTPRSSVHAWHDAPRLDHRHTWPDDSQEAKSFCALDDAANDGNAASPVVSRNIRFDSLPASAGLLREDNRPRAATLDAVDTLNVLEVPLLAPEETATARPVASEDHV